MDGDEDMEDMEDMDPPSDAPMDDMDPPTDAPVAAPTASAPTGMVMGVSALVVAAASFLLM